MVEVHRVFDEMIEWDDFSCNTMIMDYVNYANVQEDLVPFEHREESRIQPIEFTCVVLFKPIPNWGL